MRIAVFPVGYFDGYPRLLSGRAHVLVSGHRAPVIGRVMMNHIVVDVSAMTSDERPVTATLIGRDGPETVSAEMFASWCQSIHYEVVARLGSHLKRIVVEE
jgi:alanine racemase